MRKNYIHNAVISNNRNDFIEQIENKSDVVVVKNNVLEEIYKEINGNLKAKKRGKFLRKSGSAVGAIGFLFSVTNPIGWLIGGSTALAAGILSSLSNEFRKYDLYNGKDINDKEILILMHKDKVDLKYDKIIYPDDIVKGSIVRIKKNKIKI